MLRGRARRGRRRRARVAPARPLAHSLVCRHLRRLGLDRGHLARRSPEPAADPRHGNRKPSQGLFDPDLQGRRPRLAEHRHAHRAPRKLQRLRGGRPQRVHQHRHSHAGQDAQRGDRRDRARDRPHRRRPLGFAAQPHCARRHQEPAAHHPGHRTDGRWGPCRRRVGAGYLGRRRRPRHGRQRHAAALHAERAPGPGIRRRPVRPAAPRGNPAIRPRHARDVRALRRAGILVREGPRPVRAQPSGGGASPQPAARKGGRQPLRQ